MEMSKETIADIMQSLEESLILHGMPSYIEHNDIELSNIDEVMGVRMIYADHLPSGDWQLVYEEDE